MTEYNISRIHLWLGGGELALELGFHLQQEQRLQLTMTPELRQSIQLLQYSASELALYIHEQIQENPLISLKEKPKNDESVGFFGVRYTSKRQRYDHHNQELYEVEACPSLIQELEEQIRLLPLNAKERDACLFLIHSLDERGMIDSLSIEECKRLQNSEILISRALHTIQSLDPAGIGARSVSECLELQLRRMKATELACQLVYHLAELAEKRYKELSIRYQCTVDDIVSAVNEIQKCNPRPVAHYGTESPRYIEPDIRIHWAQEDYTVQLNERLIPQIEIHSGYDECTYRLLDDSSKEYVRGAIQRAIWLSKAIEQRRKTILSVTQTVIEYQRAFFEQGEFYLRPLNLREVAEEIGVHESTVSRVTQNKFIETNRGVFPFRYFFPNGIINQHGIEMTTTKVKNQIAELITDEDPAQPLSDQLISNLLGQTGISISRRTVAKYREELGIPSSTKRRRG